MLLLASRLNCDECHETPCRNSSRVFEICHENCYAFCHNNTNTLTLTQLLDLYAVIFTMTLHFFSFLALTMQLTSITLCMCCMREHVYAEPNCVARLEYISLILRKENVYTNDAAFLWAHVHTRWKFNYSVRALENTRIHKVYMSASKEMNAFRNWV